MKVVVQNGAQHGIPRREAEAIIPLFPDSWRAAVHTLVLGGRTEAEVAVRFYPKEKALWLFWPSSGPRPGKEQAIETLLVALAAISERGGLEERMPVSQAAALASEISGLKDACMQLVSQRAVS